MLFFRCCIRNNGTALSVSFGNKSASVNTFADKVIYYRLGTFGREFKIIIGLDMAETGVNILIVAAGYIKGNTAPIFSKASLTPAQMTDPVPQALVLTSIVIGFGVTALALALVVRLYQKTGSLDVSKIRGLKW